VTDKGRLFEEFDRHLLEDEKPSCYFNEKEKTGIFRELYPFTMLGVLPSVKQSPKYHPEGNVWNHTMQVVDRAAERKGQSQKPRVLMWSALLHDLGKAPTTKIQKGRITAYDHDVVGEKLAVQFLRELTDDEEFIHDVAKMVRWHMQILFVVKDLPFANLEGMTAEVPIDEIALLALCDRLGREPMSREMFHEELKNVEIFRHKCWEYLKQRSVHDKTL